ncbi:MAG TPA: hypothetical protein VFR42_00300 [Candidatus Acidoferrum sp.]|nr:hypothetical protein [Candidatus Acidoferrum sp.]
MGISLEILWSDEDLFAVKVVTWNGSFGAVAKLYVEIGGLDKLAAIISGFPKDANDARETVLGAFGREYAGGAASLRLFCIDRAGHAYVECKVESGEGSAGVFQTATLIMPVEASAIDRFVIQLRKLERDKQGAAVLVGQG